MLISAPPFFVTVPSGGWLVFTLATSDRAPHHKPPKHWQPGDYCSSTTAGGFVGVPSHSPLNNTGLPPRTGGESSGFSNMALPPEPPPKSQNPPRTGG